MMSDDLPDSQRATAPPPAADPELVQTLRETGAGRLTFGRFRLMRELGRGGMGVVWLARDERLGLDVALKFLPGMVSADPEALHDLRKEVTRCFKLSHEGIVRVYDLHEGAGDEKALAAIAMEYVDGKTLAEEKALQPERCFDAAEPLEGWVSQICDILAYVHEKKVVHRDLKPRNVMVNGEGRIKIADFGIAASICDSHSRLTQHPGSSGTPVYMSPQQALAQNPTVADDIYSLGATVYELLTSKPPFFRGSTAVILNAVSTQRPPTMAARREELGILGKKSIPQAWESAIAACLAKAPGERPASGQALLGRLCGSARAESERGSISQPADRAPTQPAPPAVPRKSKIIGVDSPRPFLPPKPRIDPAAQTLEEPRQNYLGNVVEETPYVASVLFFFCMVGLGVALFAIYLAASNYPTQPAYSGTYETGGFYFSPGVAPFKTVWGFTAGFLCALGILCCIIRKGAAVLLFILALACAVPAALLPYQKQAKLSEVTEDFNRLRELHRWFREQTAMEVLPGTLPERFAGVEFLPVKLTKVERLAETALAFTRRSSDEGYSVLMCDGHIERMDRGALQNRLGALIDAESRSGLDNEEYRARLDEARRRLQ